LAVVGALKKTRQPASKRRGNQYQHEAGHAIVREEKLGIEGRDEFTLGRTLIQQIRQP
jgi:hypothetical protein